MEEVEPLIEEGEKVFEWRFDKEVKEHKEDIDLRDTCRQTSTDSDNRHEEEVY